MFRTLLDTVGNNTMTEIDTIYTFNNGGQISGVIGFDEPPTEAWYLWKAMKSIGRENRKMLRKISACQLHCSSEEDALPWVKESNGKYFFSCDVGVEED